MSSKSYHTDSSAKASRWQRFCESRPHHARISVNPRNLAPNHARLAPIDRLLGTIHVSNSLAQVETGVLRRRDIFDLKKRNKRMLGMFATLVAEMTSFGVESTHASRIDGWMVRRRELEYRTLLLEEAI